MKNIRNFSLIFGILLTTVFHLRAQEKVIHGFVTTFDSIPLVEAKVMVKSTKQIVYTDTLGRFSVGCNKSDKLKITAHGFYSQNANLGENIKVIAINLKLKPGEKSRAYAVGYGHVLEEEKLNAVANLNQNDLDFSQYSDLYEVIRGRFAGVQIINGEIIIRGINSVNSSSAALIIVDGVPTGGDVLSSLPPIEVKSIDIIKDGSSAIYGSRGANGVVLIQTKKGGDR